MSGRTASVNDEDQLYDLSNELLHKHEELLVLLLEINNKINSVCNDQGWNDDSTKDFLEKFEEAIRNTVTLADMMEDFAGYVRRKADKVVEYHNQK